ncbi:hypothetical protein B1H26_39720 [Amycolatopsis sp. BJA-103]|nr:hypothetical protein B1H26_39720 [Amycolatopsis sp. BJA-103]
MVRSLIERGARTHRGDNDLRGRASPTSEGAGGTAAAGQDLRCCEAAGFRTEERDKISMAVKKEYDKERAA